MAAKPIAINCLVYPRNKTVAPYPATIVGLTWDPTLEIGGGPIVTPPTGELPKPPGDWEIWPPDRWLDTPEHPIVIPPTPPPVDPPTAPTPPHEGWNWSTLKNGWYYIHVPGEGEPEPKRPRR